MAIFKVGDKVYFPTYSSRILTLGSTEDGYGKRDGYPLSVRINSEQGYSFTADGKFYKNHMLPSIFHATPENRIILEHLYGKEFESVRDDLVIIEELLKS